jgi:hypothetical protein
VNLSNPEAAPDTACRAPEPLKSWFSPYATGKMPGLRQYGYIVALVALTLALKDAEFLGASVTPERVVLSRFLQLFKYLAPNGYPLGEKFEVWNDCWPNWHYSSFYWNCYCFG